MPPLTLSLTPEDLEEIRYRLKVDEPRVIRRANVLNCLHLGYRSGDIAMILNVDPKTVTNVGNVYLESGLDGALYDDERSGRPIDIDDRERSRIVAMVCSKPPEGFYRWTLDLIVDEAHRRNLVKDGISRESVRIILQEHDLKPWREKMWCVPELDEQYIERMEALLDLYEKPHDPRHPVLCLDEKPVALFSDKRERLAVRKPGQILHEYVRAGSANVFCAVEPKAGRYINKVTQTRDGLEFSIFLTELANEYSSADKIALVMDNLSTHSLEVLKQHMDETLAQKVWERFEVYFTPKHASWLNQAEIAIGMYSRQCLGDGRVGNLFELTKKTAAWNKAANVKGQVIQWRFTKSKARKSFGYTE